MTEAGFSIHGACVRIFSLSTEFAYCVEALQRDFVAFSPVATGPWEIEVEICDEIPSHSRLPRLVLRKSHVEVRGWFNRRVNTYHQVQAESAEAAGVRRFWVAGKNSAEVRETAYKFILSAAGEILDLRGLHRMHGLGFAHANMRGVLLASSGAGKSALAGILGLRSRRFQLYSDESPLLKGQNILPFPTRLSMDQGAARALGFGEGEELSRTRYRPKTLYPFPVGNMASSGKLDAIFVARKIAGPTPRIVRCSRWSLLPEMFLSLVVGQGLAQMAEWMLRISVLPRLTKVLARRLLSFVQLLRLSGNFYRFEMTPDAVANSACLESLVQSFLVSQPETKWLEIPQK